MQIPQNKRKREEETESREEETTAQESGMNLYQNKRSGMKSSEDQTYNQGGRNITLISFSSCSIFLANYPSYLAGLNFGLSSTESKPDRYNKRDHILNQGPGGVLLHKAQARLKASQANVELRPTRSMSIYTQRWSNLLWKTHDLDLINWSNVKKKKRYGQSQYEESREVCFLFK